jgi:hypothetical protein
MKVDMRKVEESKRQFRRRLAALPFAEKLRLLEELRDRNIEIGATSLRSPATRGSNRFPSSEETRGGETGK